MPPFFASVQLRTADVAIWGALQHMLFAAVSWNIIEVVVNPMLATTASMSILGMFFLFAGFFVLVRAPPRCSMGYNGV